MSVGGGAFTKRRVVESAAAAIVVVAALALAWNVTTSQGRVAATTSGSSFFSAGMVQLDRTETSVELLFDADALYPGVVVDGCVAVAYDGTGVADIRLHGDRAGGTGLDRYLDVEFAVAEGDVCDQADVDPSPAWVGRLDEMWTVHGSWTNGVELGRLEPGQVLSIFATAEVVDDDEAQGRTTDFTLTVEARP